MSLPSSLKSGLCRFALSAGLALLASQDLHAAEAQTGAISEGHGDRAAELVSPQAASGLKVFFKRYGKYEVSVDAKGSNDSKHIVKVKKPHKRAKVVKAYLLASSNYATVIENGDIKLDNKKVRWIASEVNATSSYPDFFYSVLADVTDIVKKKIDKKKKAGKIRFKLKEKENNSYIDGEILVVVFKNKKVRKRRTVALMFGGQQLSGDRFEVRFKKPLKKKKRGAVAKMGLGISYSCQFPDSSVCADSGQQYSVVDVNSKRLTTSAGGEDDGASSNGALITVGGIGDKPRNPGDPNATPTDPRDDDELYNLKPFLPKRARKIYVDTSNPSDDDNIFFAWFELSAKGTVNKDTDGDGLLDSWEKKGYDHDGDGEVDVKLHKMGAHWKKKDIFICYAWMEKGPDESKSHKPKKKVLRMVKRAFRNAPVKNKKGPKGIRLHFIKKGSVPHDDNLYPVWDEFEDLMDPLVSEAERAICHRMLNAHAYDYGSSSGLSRGIPHSDFIETLGEWSTNPGTNQQRAGTIMHELGHNLGLRHGGPDHEGWKPNHLSVMSYLNQMDGVLYKRRAKLDYERFKLKPLDETDLNEKRGLSRKGRDKKLRKYGVRYFPCTTDRGLIETKKKKAHRNVNWNDSGSSKQKGVSCDINGSGTQSTLAAKYSEWDNLVYDGGNVGPGRAEAELNMITSADDLDELTYEDYVSMFPPRNDRR